MAQQGPPPRRSSGRPDSGDGGYERHWQDRLRRPERPEGAQWRQLEEAFRPDTDADLPPWAAPQPGARRGPAPQRGAGRTQLEDPYGERGHRAGGQEQAGTGYRGRRRGADADVDAYVPEQDAYVPEQDVYLTEQDRYPAGPYAGEAEAYPADRAPDPYRPTDPYGRADAPGRDEAFRGTADDDSGREQPGRNGRHGQYDRAEAAWDPALAPPARQGRGGRSDRGDEQDELAGGFAPRRIARRGRAAAARLRKSRRRVVRLCAAAIVMCVIAAGIVVFVTHHTPPKQSYVTSLQKGEYKAAPDACSSITAATLSQYLPGPGLTKSDEQSGSAESQCSFTIDHKPDLLVLEVTSAQYQPLAAASGNGSASQNAQDNFAQAQQGLAHPVRHSPLSRAAITTLAGLGQQAIAAVQTEHAGGIVTDLVTVLVRERNVLVTVSMSGQESGHGFGPVAVTTLQAGATAAARNVLAKLSSIPTA